MENALARKHCGRQREWRISLDRLQEKCGSSSTGKEFKRLVGRIAEQDAAPAHIPDYAVRLESETVAFINRGKLMEAPLLEEAASAVRPLNADVYALAREAAPEWDVYYLEREWRDWITEPPRNPEAPFLGFCKKWFEKRGAPR